MAAKRKATNKKGAVKVKAHCAKGVGLVRAYRRRKPKK